MGCCSRSDEGFTVIEVVVAITILVVVLLAAALLLENTILVSGNTRNRVVAANLATQAIENVRGMAADPTKFVLIPQGGTVSTQSVNGVPYRVSQEATFMGTNSTTSSCDSPGSTNGQILQIRESVTWPGMGGTQPVQQVTTLAPPVGVYSANAGAIAAKVFDSTGAAAAGVTVQTSGPSVPAVQVQQTTSEGCAYFYGFVPGTYTVSVQGTGVSDQEVPTPTQTASVSVGQTASVQFLYDTPGTIIATLPSPTNTPGAPPYASGLSISVVNTGLQPYGQFTFAASTGTDTTTSPSLFPYASGYTVYAGNCTDNNPLGKDTSGNYFYTAAPAPVSVPAGGTATTTLSLYPVALHVQNSTGVAVNTTPTATESAFPPVLPPAPPAYTPLCSAGTTSATAPTLGLATTTATGDSVTALPLGHWTITATCTKPQPACPTSNKTATLNIWVKPDAVYAVDGTGAATTPYAGPITAVVN